MANERATAQVFLDGKQAEAALDGLKAKSKELKQAIIEAGKAGDNVTMKKLQTELRSVESAQRSLKKETFDVQKVLNNLNGASLDDIQKAARKVNAEMRRMDRTDPGFREKQKQAKALRGELNRVNAEMREQPGFMKKATDAFNNYFGVAAAGIAAMAGVGLTIQKAVDAANEREDMRGQVKALTGLAEEELDYLEQTAQKAATTVTESQNGISVRIQKSTDEILQAYQLVGSAKPELLANKEALAEVTKEIMVLAEASEGMDLSVAVDATTKAMNQYGAGAEQAARFTNAMAAGAKFGAVAIPEIGEAIKVFGVNANKANVPVEGSVALIEVLGEKAGLVGPQAGTSLRNFFSILASGPKETNPEIVGLTAAMDALQKKNMSSAEYTKMFGRENANVAQILVANKQYVEELTETLTGTETAYEQANDNTKDRIAKLNQAKAASHEYAVEIGEKLAPAQLHLVSSGKLILKTISALIDLFKQHGTEILLVAGAVAAYTIALKLKNAESKLSIGLTKAQAIAQAAWGTVVGVVTGQITIATVAQKLWNSVITANPIGAIFAAVLLLTAGIVALVKVMNRQTAAQKAINDVQKQAKQDIIDQKVETESLLDVLKDENKSREEKEAALKRLNEISPEYFNNLSIEKSTTEELTAAGEAYIKNLEKQALVKAAQEKIDALRRENAQKEIDIETKKSKWYETTAGATRRATKSINENKDAIKELQGLIDKNVDKTITTTTTNTTTPDTDPDQPAGDPLKALEESHKAEMLELKRQMIERNETQEWYNNQALLKELEYLARKRELQAAAGEDTLDTDEAILDKQIKLRDGFQKNIEDMDKTISNLEKEVIEMPEIDLESFDEEYQKGIEALDRYDELKEKIKTDEESQAELFTQEMADLTDAYEMGILSHEEFEKRKAEITRNYTKKSIEIYGEYLNSVGSIVNGLGEMFSDQKDAELEKAGDNAAQKEAIERKYAKKQQAVAKGQAAISAAQAILQLWAQPSVIPEPANSIFKGIQAAIIVGTTAAQIKKINAQQFYTGGYTAPGTKYQPAGIVHAGEFVASQEAVQNPTVKPFLDMINIAQKNGTTRRLNLPQAVVSSYSAPMPGFAAGGYVAQSSNTTQTREVIQTDPALIETMRQMTIAANRLADKELSLSMSELNRKSKQYEEIQNSVNLKK